MKQLVNLIFWCLTLSTLAVSDSCNGHGGSFNCNSNTSYCVCEPGWVPSTGIASLDLPSGCTVHIGPDCSRKA
jgi:hypothetical protein